MNNTGIDYDVCIRKISQQDQFALEELYREQRDPIYRFALILLHDQSLAEDAMQSTFLRIMASAGTYRLGSNPRAWIFSIARNVCTDIRKSKIPVAEDSVLNAVADDFLIDDLADSISVRQAVARLTAEQREIISLYIFGGLKQTEIAKVLNLPYIRVRSQYGYAIRKLRKELSGK